MKYYKITYQIENIYPQVSVPETYAFYDENSIHNLSYFEFPDFKPNFEGLHLNEGAILKDLLSHIAIEGAGLLISNKLKNTINLYNIYNPMIYTFQLKVNNGYEEYNWLQLLNFEIDKYIDFDKSNLFVEDAFSKLRKELNITSSKEYNDILKELGDTEFIKSNRLILNNDFKSMSLDLFFIIDFLNSVIISERLKEEILKNNITGVEIKESYIEVE